MIMSDTSTGTPSDGCITKRCPLDREQFPRTGCPNPTCSMFAEPASHPLREALLARLHLQAVLPALEDLVALSPAARRLAEGWKATLRLRLSGHGGPAATLVSPGDGSLRVHPHGGGPAQMTLLFLSPGQLNRTFLNAAALPPLPLGAPWNLAKLPRFTKLAAALNTALQPAAGALDDAAYRDVHLRLLFRVLVGAIPPIGMGDPAAVHSLSHTPAGLAEIRSPARDLRGWVKWTGRTLTSGLGAPPQVPDVAITFRDLATIDAALLGTLDNQSAVGLGQIDVRGLVPLADGLGMVMDKVDGYLKPPSPRIIPMAKADDGSGRQV